MTPVEVISLILKASILAIVFALGLGARPKDLLALVRRPLLLAKSLLAMVVIMPLTSVLLVKTLGLPGSVAVMLIVLPLAPTPPILPRKQAKAEGDHDYAIGLLVTAGLASIVWIPLALALMQRMLGLPLDIAPTRVASVVAVTILAPLTAGIAVAFLAPPLAAKWSPIISRVGGMLLALAALVILVSQWRHMVGLLGVGALSAFAIFVAVGLIAGHLLGGPDPSDRTVLAIATSSRHPGMALAIAHANFPHAQALVAAVLLFLVVNAVVSIPYVAWRKRAGAADALGLGT
jgi:BASS family bile acid:Na+ symporter